MIKSQPQLDSLIHQCISGDGKACKELYDSFKNSLFAICLRYYSDRSKAEDMLQEGFILIFKNLAKYDSTKGAFYTWSSKIIVNVIIGELRKRRLEVQYEDHLPDRSGDQGDLPIHDLSMRELTMTIQSLPEGYRTVFNMYVMDGMTHREIGEALGVSPNTSKTQYMYARKAMQKKLQKLQIYAYVK